jgi:hypothetical protein
MSRATESGKRNEPAQRRGWAVFNDAQKPDTDRTAIRSPPIPIAAPPMPE